MTSSFIPGLSPERQRKATEYASVRRAVFFVEAGLTVALLFVLALSGLSLLLRRLLVFPWPVAAVLALAALLVAYNLVMSPLTVYGGFVLPRRFGLLTQSWSGWLIDRAKGLVLEMGIGSGFLIAIYWMVARFPRTWWLLAGILVFLVTVLLTNLAPVVILPLFFKLRRLEEGELAQRLTRLTERAGVRTVGVFVVDFSRKSTAANAALMGLGNTRRVAITDTLLKTPAEEIEAILAHELGHHRHGDIRRLVAFQSIAVLAGFFLLSSVSSAVLPALGYGGLADVAALPWIALFFFLYVMVVGPLFNGYSRGLEREADRYAVGLTGKLQPFVDTMARLTDQNLAEARPPRWAELLFYDHPPYFRRVADARQYAGASECKEDSCSG